MPENGSQRFPRKVTQNSPNRKIVPVQQLLDKRLRALVFALALNKDDRGGDPWMCDQWELVSFRRKFQRGAAQVSSRKQMGQMKTSHGQHHILYICASVS